MTAKIQDRQDGEAMKFEKEKGEIIMLETARGVNCNRLQTLTFLDQTDLAHSEHSQSPWS